MREAFPKILVGTLQKSEASDQSLIVWMRAHVSCFAVSSLRLVQNEKTIGDRCSGFSTTGTTKLGRKTNHLAELSG